MDLLLYLLICTQYMLQRLKFFLLVKLVISSEVITVFQNTMVLPPPPVQYRRCFQEIAPDDENLNNQMTIVLEHASNAFSESGDHQPIYLEEDVPFMETNYLNITVGFDNEMDSSSVLTENHNLVDHYSNEELNHQNITADFEPILDSFSELEEHSIVCLGTYCSEIELETQNVTTVFGDVEHCTIFHELSRNNMNPVNENITIENMSVD